MAVVKRKSKQESVSIIHGIWTVQGRDRDKYRDGLSCKGTVTLR